MTLLHATPGGLTLTINVFEGGGLEVSARSASYGPHTSFVRIDSDGTNPVVVVQQGADAHVVVAPAGAGDLLYDSAAQA